MATSNAVKNNFTSGEIDVSVQSRIDNRHYINGAKGMRNVLVRPQGGFELRFGSEQIQEIPAASGGELSDTRLIEFEFSNTQRFLHMYYDSKLRVFKDGVQQAEISTAYTHDKLSEINWSQDLDTLILFHPDIQPRQIQRGATDADWTQSTVTFTNIPTYDFGSGAEAVISGSRGWPVSGIFYQGRLIMGGTKSRPQTVLGSKAGDFFNLDEGTGLDDEAINVTANTKDVAAIYYTFPGQHLQFFSSSKEFYVPASDSEGLTPSNFALVKSTEKGSKRGLRVFDVAGGTIYFQATKSLSGTPEVASIQEFLFADSKRGYISSTISVTASHLIRNPRRTAIRRATEDEDADFLLIVNDDDGTMTVLCMLREHDVNAYTLSMTAGKFIDVAVDGKDIYIVTERTINGTTKRFLERMYPEMYVDCGVRAVDLSSPVSSVDVSHLIGEEVEIMLDGAWQNPQTVPAGGTITFDRDAVSSYQVGLKWPIVDTEFNNVWQVETLPPEVETRQGLTFGIPKRIVEAAIKVEETVTFKVNNNRIVSRKFGGNLLDQAPPTITGTKRIKGIKGRGTDITLKFGDNRPNKVNIHGFSQKVGF